MLYRYNTDSWLDVHVELNLPATYARITMLFGRSRTKLRGRPHSDPLAYLRLMLLAVSLAAASGGQGRPGARSQQASDPAASRAWSNWPRGPSRSVHPCSGSAVSHLIRLTRCRICRKGVTQHIAGLMRGLFTRPEPLGFAGARARALAWAHLWGMGVLDLHGKSDKCDDNARVAVFLGLGPSQLWVQEAGASHGSRAWTGRCGCSLLKIIGSSRKRGMRICEALSGL